jgi:adenylate cyclase
MNDHTSIVIVDDDQDLAGPLTEILGRHDTRYSVSNFQSGQAFLEYFSAAERKAPDLVLLDLKLGKLEDLSGLQVRKQASLSGAFESTLFIAFSGYLSDIDRHWLVELGFDAYLHKGCTFPLMIETIRSLLSEKAELLARREPYKNLFAVIDELSRLTVRKSVLEKDYIERLISPEVFRLMETNPDSLQPRNTEAAIGFVDIRDFTQLMNRIDIRQVSIILELFVDYISGQVASAGGFVDKFIGDAVMWFHHGSEVAAINRACVQVAVGIQRNIGRLNKQIQARLHQRIPIHLGVGIASGTCAVGLFGGARHRKQYTVLGSPVNLAARLCSDARSGEVLAGGSLLQNCDTPSRPAGFRTVKGFDYEIEVRRLSVKEATQESAAAPSLDPVAPLVEIWPFVTTKSAGS